MDGVYAPVIDNGENLDQEAAPMKRIMKMGLLLAVACVAMGTALEQESADLQLEQESAGLQLEQESADLQYEEFIRQLDGGNIRSVQLDDTSRLHGVYVVDGEERAFRSFAGRGAAYDPLLIRELKRQGVDMVIEKPPIEFPSFWLMGVSLMKLGILVLGLGVLLITLIYIARVNKKVNLLMKQMKNTSQ